MRKRNKEIIFRMTPDEYCLFDRMVENAGFTKQKYLLTLIFNSDIQSLYMDDEKNPVDTFKDKLK